ncbi:unnamed protein product [Amoebophrya sp. A120]|nr:unnamed protein product [Amoebophrya sp. A120]|eukprot:GSA120T00024559001.1
MSLVLSPEDQNSGFFSSPSPGGGGHNATASSPDHAGGFGMTTSGVIPAPDGHLAQGQGGTSYTEEQLAAQQYIEEHDLEELLAGLVNHILALRPGSSSATRSTSLKNTVDTEPQALQAAAQNVHEHDKFTPAIAGILYLAQRVDSHELLKKHGITIDNELVNAFRLPREAEREREAKARERALTEPFADTVWEKLIAPALRAGQSLQAVFEESNGVIGESTTSSDMLLNLNTGGNNIKTSTSGAATMIGAGANNILKSTKFFTWLTEALLDFTKGGATSVVLHPDGDEGAGQQQKLSSGKKHSDHYQLEQLPQVTLDEVAVYRISLLAEKEPDVVFDCKDEEEKTFLDFLLDYDPTSSTDKNTATKNNSKEKQNTNLVLAAAKAAANWIKNNNSSVLANRTKKPVGGTSKEK